METKRELNEEDSEVVAPLNSLVFPPPVTVLPGGIPPLPTHPPPPPPPPRVPPPPPPVTPLPLPLPLSVSSSSTSTGVQTESKEMKEPLPDYKGDIEQFYLFAYSFVGAAHVSMSRVWVLEDKQADILRAPWSESKLSKMYSPLMLSAITGAIEWIRAYAQPNPVVSLEAWDHILAKGRLRDMFQLVVHRTYVKSTVLSTQKWPHGSVAPNIQADLARAQRFYQSY
jgi:hypothetical protein